MRRRASLDRRSTTPHVYEMNFCWSNHWINEIKWWNTLNIQFRVWKFWVQFFFHFWEKLCHQNLAKTLLWAQISILEFSIVYPRKIGNFIYPMAYSKPKNSNSNYSKIAFKECKELWRGLYIPLWSWVDRILKDVKWSYGLKSVIEFRQ